jgi:hypothetical protein
MKAVLIGALLPLLAVAGAHAQIPSVPTSTPHVDVLPNESWLCRQTAASLDESTLLGGAILARLGDPRTAPLDEIEFRRGGDRLGAAIAAFAIERGRGVVYVNDSTDGATLLHEITHAMMLRLPPDSAALEIASVMAADSAGTIDPFVLDMARRSFTLSFTASADPQLWGLVPMVLTNAALSDTSARGTLDRLVQATDSAAVRLEGSISKGWGRSTIADAYDAAADSHWHYAGVERPRWWTWNMERTFRLIGEVRAYTRAMECSGS